MNLPANRPGDWVYGNDWRPCFAEPAATTTPSACGETSIPSLSESEVNAMTPNEYSPVSQDVAYVTKDSGKREEYATGSMRDTTEGKGSYTSISPHMLRRLAMLMERGAKKYGLFNYQKGQPFSRVVDSLMRHTNQARMGDESEDHKSAIIFNAMAWIHFEEEIAAGRLPETLDDLP
jgi:hypothetical protein